MPPRTLGAAHKKLHLTVELGEEGVSELPGVLMEVYKISMYAMNAKTMLSGITWFYTPSNPGELKRMAFKVASELGEPHIRIYQEEANMLRRRPHLLYGRYQQSTTPIRWRSQRQGVSPSLSLFWGLVRLEHRTRRPGPWLPWLLTMLRTSNRLPNS